MFFTLFHSTRVCVCVCFVCVIAFFKTGKLIGLFFVSVSIKTGVCGGDTIFYANGALI